MDQAKRAFHERDEYYKDPNLYDSLYAEYTKQVEGLQHQFKAITGILSTQKTDTGMYEYPSSPSLDLHLGELDDKPKEYFENTKKEVSHKNTLAKWVIGLIGCFLTDSTYLVGVWVIVYYMQVLLPIGIAWLCEMWYRILLIGCLCLSLRCDTWFTS